MSFTYDPENIFAKILRGEIPCDRVHETDHALAFRDIRPQAPIHILVIPKGAYVSLDHFCMEGTDAEIAGFWRAVGEVTAGAGVEAGFRAIANARDHAHQEVPHFHVHILAGRALGPMLAS